ncbi:SDR family NAD(P)-dependent oxidoreductase [Dickeya dadantii]|uniref:SDR family NAD(P)-dependent oxidoreductase n=1 Tax=Dickeya dadantii TaxID=204038 RepID=UPI0020A66E48|nr:SDR family NAD(P)-dependent oxidoreductase [Dickeya dadantii]
MPGLSDKIAIITGASSGIGYATTKRFAQEGAHVVVGVRRQPELNALIEEITRASGHAVALAGDVKSEAFAKVLVELAMDCFGGLDIAFNSGGRCYRPSQRGKLGANPVAFLIPCHRVIQQSGKIGGYHWGETRKHAMHAWESASYE